MNEETIRGCVIFISLFAWLVLLWGRTNRWTKKRFEVAWFLSAYLLDSSYFEDEPNEDEPNEDEPNEDEPNEEVADPKKLFFLRFPIFAV